MTLVAERRTLYAFDRFTIDREDERLFDSHGPVRLGNKAFQVLLRLIEQRGRLVTKDLLMSTVWDGTIVSESALTSVIKELRRALGDDARRPRCIESVYGRGYRLLCGVSAAEESNGGPTSLPDPTRLATTPFAVGTSGPSASPFAMRATAPSPAAGLLPTSAPAGALALGRKLTQRLVGALFLTSLLTLVPTGIDRGSEPVDVGITAGIL